MLVQSTISPKAIEEKQGKKLVNFNITATEKQNEMSEEVEKGFEYTQVQVSTDASRDEIIEAVMSTRYSVGAEIALTNDRESKTVEYTEYQAFRVLAKELADLSKTF